MNEMEDVEKEPAFYEHFGGNDEPNELLENSEMVKANDKELVSEVSGDEDAEDALLGGKDCEESADKYGVGNLIDGRIKVDPEDDLDTTTTTTTSRDHFLSGENGLLTSVDDTPSNVVIESEDEDDVMLKYTTNLSGLTATKMEEDTDSSLSASCSIFSNFFNPEDSTSKITLAFSKNTKDKQFHDKAFACYYCSKLYTNMRIHYLRRHPKEKLVQEIQQYSIGSPDRSNLLMRLRNLGNFKHNIHVLKNNEGILLTNRRPSKKYDHQDYTDYIPCKFCYGFFFKYDLKKHACFCVFNETENTKHILSDGIHLLYEATSNSPSQDVLDISPSFIRDLLHFNTISTDYLITRFGNFLADCGYVPISEISEKMSYLCRLLDFLKEENQSFNFELCDFFNPKYIGSFINGVHRLKGIVDEYDLEKFSAKINHCIRLCSNIKIGIAIKENDVQMLKESHLFLLRYMKEWKGKIKKNTLGGNDNDIDDKGNDFELIQKKRSLEEPSPSESKNKRKKSMCTNNVINSLEVSLAKDLTVLCKFLEEHIQERLVSLQKDACLENWLELTQACLCKIVIFNKRRGDDMTKMLLSSFTCEDNWCLNDTDEGYKSLTRLEKTICKKYEVIQIKNRREKLVPVIIPPETKVSLDLLTATREVCGIPKQNPYLFSTSTNNGYYRSWNIINKFGRQCNLNKIHLLTNTNLRKFISTCSQILSLNVHEVLDVSEQLDLNIADQHLSIYECPIELTKVCDLFLSLETNTSMIIGGTSESFLPSEVEDFEKTKCEDDSNCTSLNEKIATLESNRDFAECDQTENYEMNVPEVELKEEPESSYALESGSYLDDDCEPDVKKPCYQFYEAGSLTEGAGADHILPSNNVKESCFSSFGENSPRSKITLAMSKNTKDKRFHDKIFACYFCSKLLTNMRIHYLRRHPEEKEVREIQEYPVGRPERCTLLFKLRNLGNFKHNVNVIKKNEGILLINRRPNRRCERQNYTNYLPCKYCYGFFYKYDLSNHCKSCTFNKDKDIKHIISEGTLLLYEATSDLPSQNILDVLSSMDKDEVFHVLCNDYLIMRFGNFMVDNQKQVDYEIIQKMRDLATMLMRLREENDAPYFSLKDFFATRYFDAIVSCVLNFANHPDCKNPCSLVRELGHSIRCCSSIKVGISFKESNDQIKIEAEEFLKLFKNEWKNRVESFVLEDGISHSIYPDEENFFFEDFFSENPRKTFPKSRKKGLKDFILSDKVIDSLKMILTRDLGILNEYLMDYIQLKKDRLEKDLCLEHWLELTQACLCRIVIFNKRRGDEMTKMLLSSYNYKGSWSLSEGDDAYKSLTLLEKLLCKRFEILRIKSRRGKYIPIIIPPETKCSLDLLCRTREDCGVPKENVFLFSNGTNNGHYRSWNIINKFGRLCNLSKIHFLTNSNLRKLITIRSQLYCVNQDDLEVLHDYLNKEDSTHTSIASHEFYRYCKLFLDDHSNVFPLQSDFCVAEISNLESLIGDQIVSGQDVTWLGALEPCSYIPSISSELDELFNDGSMSPEPMDRPERFIWPKDLKAALLKRFEVHIKEERAPGKKQCIEFLKNMHASSIPWKKVKDCVKNAYYKRK